MKTNILSDLENQIRSYYDHRIKKDWVSLVIIFAIGLIFEIRMNSDIYIFSTNAILIVLIFVDLIKNENEKVAWVSAYKGNILEGGMFSKAWQMPSRPNFREILEKEPRLKRSRFAKRFKKLN